MLVLSLQYYLSSTFGCYSEGVAGLLRKASLGRRSVGIL